MPNTWANPELPQHPVGSPTSFGVDLMSLRWSSSYAIIGLAPARIREDAAGGSHPLSAPSLKPSQCPHFRLKVNTAQLCFFGNKVHIKTAFRRCLDRVTLHDISIFLLFPPLVVTKDDAEHCSIAMSGQGQSAYTSIVVSRILTRYAILCPLLSKGDAKKPQCTCPHAVKDDRIGRKIGRAHV